MLKDSDLTLTMTHGKNGIKNIYTYINRERDYKPI